MSMSWSTIVRCTDMHTAGEPLRIIESVHPEIEVVGDSILDKQASLKRDNDWLRRLVIEEPRGHRDMYAVMLFGPPEKPAANVERDDEYEFGAVFMHSEGYSSMCGHAVIALARYARDKRIYRVSERLGPLRIMCPCGPVEALLTLDGEDKVTTSFLSVPAFLQQRDLQLHHAGLGGPFTADLCYGGAFYLVIKQSRLATTVLPTHSHNVEQLFQLISVADQLKREVSSTTSMKHPTDRRLEFLYGVIFVDDSEASSGLYRVLTVYATKSLDRSPCGSGVTAVMTDLFMTSDKSQRFRCPTRFQNAILKEKSEFTAKISEETMLQFEDGNEVEAVRVEVSGSAFYTGQHEFTFEHNDPLKDGFQIYL